MKIEYKISNDYPPKKIYKKALKLFGRDVVNFKKGTTFTVNDTIYCITPVPEDLLVHELTHVRQQTAMGWRKWWRKYFKHPEFRYSQEIIAYQNQMKYIKDSNKNREVINRYLHSFAKSLSSSLYGNIISYQDAIQAIKKYENL